jgi:hypothetical protein
VSNPPPSPAERFATCLQWLTKAVVAMMGGERLPLLLIGQIVDRIRRIKQRFATLAARIAAGKYVPRTGSAPPRKRPGQTPPPKGPLPNTFGWLLKLVPEAVQYRGQLEYLLQDPEMAALLAAAPASLRRPLRSLCWMLHLTPPPILAPPPSARRKTRPPKPERPPAEKRPKKPEKVRYVFGLRYPPPFPDPT